MTASWGSEEWVVATSGPVAAALAGHRLSATLSVTVSGGASGEVSHHRVIDDGRVTGGGPGVSERADVSFVTTADQLRAMTEGTVDPSVAFMRGRLKTAGDAGLVLEILGAWSAEEGRAALRQVAAATDFDA